ncbi:hypothetical protein KBA63_00760 [Candidatus Woesebacteria bacterium]|nr:hypothetical protein [Candidatus Woesebacteria bacterium]MBP9687761.1 hypothetical protein [Candidatus Woesebacteria bacterium]
MSENEVVYIPVDTSKRGGEARALKVLQKEHVVPVIPPDPEDEVVDTTSIPDAFGPDVHEEEKRETPVKKTMMPVSTKGTHASHSSQKYE